jgi:hypothetical protein
MESFPLNEIRGWFLPRSFIPKFSIARLPQIREEQLQRAATTAGACNIYQPISYASFPLTPVQLCSLKKHAPDFCNHVYAPAPLNFRSSQKLFQV